MGRPSSTWTRHAVVGQRTSGDVVPTTISWISSTGTVAARSAARAAPAASEGVLRPWPASTRFDTPWQSAPLKWGAELVPAGGR